MALSEELQKAGHQVTLVVSSIDNSSYADMCQRLAIRYRQIPAHIDFDMPSFAQKTFRMNTLQWLNALLEAAFFPYEQAIYEASKRLVEENDCVIGHHFLYPLKLAASKQKKPHFSVTFCHGAIAMTEHPPFRFPDLGALINRFQWHILDYIFDFALKNSLSKLWLREGMPAFKHVFPELLNSNFLNLVAVDPLFCPYQNQWHPTHQVCGFLNLSDTAETWLIPKNLQQFIEQGEKPVYMTFGSLQQAVPDWSMNLFIEAAQQTNCRAIIQTSSDRYPPETQHGDIYFVGKHPHQTVFRHCAAVVHHGGAGTTHTATLSGCPSIVVPFMDEQLFWAYQLQHLGLASAPLLAKNATATVLSERITAVLQSANLPLNALKAKDQIESGQGTKKAVDLIEAALTRFHEHH
ncbi:glycosyltransferase [Methylobacter luteus]|uniref:glycosyltransferase n=1 Tax=Methylobacter luteus TaxID=415 RepID=UPI0018CA0181|nr:glycosyltransferase [Methylobacter luteus]